METKRIFEIAFENGMRKRIRTKSMLGAKIKATKMLAFGCGDATVTDTETGEYARKVFWQSGNRFGWYSWQNF